MMHFSKQAENHTKELHLADEPTGPLPCEMLALLHFF